MKNNIKPKNKSSALVSNWHRQLGDCENESSIKKYDIINQPLSNELNITLKTVIHQFIFKKRRIN